MINLESLMAESHRRQYAGEDYQAVAIDLATGAGIKPESPEYLDLESAPAPGCECSFCKTTEWLSLDERERD